MGNYELQRTDSICTPPEVQLLEYVKANNSAKIQSFVIENPNSVNVVIGHPYDKPILYIACYELANQIRPETIEMLVKLGAPLHHTDEVHNHMQAVHFATLGGNPKALEVILRHLKPGDINSLTSNNNSALNLVVKEGDFANAHNGLVECVRMLVLGGINVNTPDAKNLSPIFWAVKKGYADVARVILYESGQSVDIDSHKLRGKSARDYMKEMKMSDAFTTPNNNETGTVHDHLFQLLKQGDEDAFVSNEYAPHAVNAEDGTQTLLQLATKKGLPLAVTFLLDHGADPNKTTKQSPSPPIQIAALNGYHKVFNVLVNRANTIIPKSTLMDLLKHVDNEAITDEINHNLCYELLLKSKAKSVDVNSGDKSDNTALHYAARYGGASRTLELLRSGASMACTNKYGSLPIEDIDCNTLETHLNECMEINFDSNIDKENFTATFNYKTLMPPPLHVADKGNFDTETACKLITPAIAQLSSETKVISYISKSPELKHLLMHPTITSFLYMKWHRIRWFFYTNLTFYISFCLSLILYILLVYGNQSDDQHNVLAYILSTFLGVTFVLLLLRELFQISVSPKMYFRQLENWLELLLLTLTAVILFERSPQQDVRKQVAAITVLLAAFEMVLLIGQHPKMSTNIVMLRTVSANFFKFLLWYSILIIAFSLSFYILLKDGPQEEKKDGGDEEVDFFVSPGLSLFKTIVMLTGEFDAGSINFNVYPVTSHVIFMLFVFMIAIILFNLLNGLAVNDTQLIKSNAELVGHVARIQHIAYIESMLLGNVAPAGIMNCCKKYCCCCSLGVTSKFFVPRTLKRRVCLFPYFLNDYKLMVYPNQYAKIALPTDVYSDSESETCFTHCTSIYLDRQTAKRIKHVIKDRKEEVESEKLRNSTIQMQNDIISEQQKCIQELKRDRQLILRKLDYLIGQIGVHQ
uniref:Ion transport domain-containing protein n=1 Tax=Photinus pyralis TaxID=7054 RepID=A0A1Y1M4Y6_PHOPY